MRKTISGPGFLRLLLAVIVFASHGTRVSIGVAAVYLFFGLSGYWIFQMYVHKYSKTKNPYFTYMVSRLWRLLPVFLLLNTAAILVELFYLHVQLFPEGWSARFHFIFSNLFILGYDSLSYKPVLPAWSLDMELQFYLIAPLLIWLVRKRPWAVIVVSALLTIISAYFALPLLTSVLFFFIAGLATAALSWKPSPIVTATSLSLALISVAVCLISPWRGVLLTGAHPGPLHIYNGLANAVLGVIALPFALYTTSQKGGRYDSVLGELSYIVYLLHWTFIELFRPPSSYLLRAIEEGIMGLIVLALAYLILRVFDKPLNRRRANWVSKRVMSRIQV